MAEITVIIVDDEESARNTLLDSLNDYCRSVKVVALCEDVEQAVKAIEKHRPDLVFLDIEMPNYAGYELVNFFDKINFDIIFVTAYEHYALKAFQLSAIDYVLKPVNPDDLVIALQKFTDKKNQSDAALNYEVLVNNLKSTTTDHIIVSVSGGKKSISLNEIIVFSASQSYTEIHTKKEKFLYSKNLKYFEKLLEDNKNFVRTHKSWIVNTLFVQKFSKTAYTIELEGGFSAKLSRYRKAQFEQSLAAL